MAVPLEANEVGGVATQSIEHQTQILVTPHVRHVGKHEIALSKPIGENTHTREENRHTVTLDVSIRTQTHPDRHVIMVAD